MEIIFGMIFFGACGAILALCGAPLWAILAFALLPIALNFCER